jgi:hypothetical protein
MTDHAAPQGATVTIETLQMMMEIGKFCGRVATGIPADEVHAALHELIGRLEAHYAEEEALMTARHFRSEEHRLLHTVILAELARVHYALERQGISLDKAKLLRLIRMFIAEGELDAVFENSFRPTAGQA